MITPDQIAAARSACIDIRIGIEDHLAETALTPAIDGDEGLKLVWGLVKTAEMILRDDRSRSTDILKIRFRLTDMARDLNSLNVAGRPAIPEGRIVYELQKCVDGWRRVVRAGIDDLQTARAESRKILSEHPDIDAVVIVVHDGDTVRHEIVERRDWGDSDVE